VELSDCLIDEIPWF